MNTTENPTPKQTSGLDGSKKIMLGLAAVLVVVVAVMYFWKTSAVSAVESKLVEAQAQSVQERSELIERARQLDARDDVESLKRFSIPLAWAIRRELMASNLDQVDQYLSELVQMPGFGSAVLANPEDKVMVATDRKNLAEPFSTLYPAQYLQAKEVRIEPTSAGGLRAIIPVMGLNQQLGTLVVEYTSPVFPLK
ncbi:MAG TPA: hypothetical protein VIN38_08385 [Thiobacillus sp.]